MFYKHFSSEPYLHCLSSSEGILITYSFYWRNWLTSLVMQACNPALLSLGQDTVRPKLARAVQWDWVSKTKRKKRTRDYGLLVECWQGHRFNLQYLKSSTTQQMMDIWVFCLQVPNLEKKGKKALPQTQTAGRDFSAATCVTSPSALLTIHTV